MGRITESICLALRRGQAVPRDWTEPSKPGNGFWVVGEAPSLKPPVPTGPSLGYNSFSQSNANLAARRLSHGFDQTLFRRRRRVPH